MKDVLRRLEKADLTEYAAIPFWSWNNRMEKDKVVEQIYEMKQAGCGGFVLHARTGLTTEYLSEEWFDLVKACLQTAKKLKMRAWIYDENGWPSGFVGGKLLEERENLAPYLERVEKTEFDSAAFAVYENDHGKLRRLREGEKSFDGVYHTVYVRLSSANTDILNPNVVEKFIRATHEEYYARFQKYFGNVLVGFFTDEPQYFRWGTPYSTTLAEYWQNEYGEDIADGIMHLFSDTEADYPFRVKYYTALNHLYTRNFYKRLYDWCEEHNCMLTGHSIEENGIYPQMWGCAGVTPSYEFEHIPGIDNLGKFGVAKLSARQVGSAAGQLGKKQILTETYGCSGYIATPKELKAIAEKQYVHGVNLMCHHLYAYSLSRQGKTDHPPCFSRHMTWWKQFPDFNRYFTRLGYLLANSAPQVNCAVFNPIASVYLHYQRFDEERARKIDEEFGRLQEQLNACAIEYDVIDETILRGHGRCNGASLAIGPRTYEHLIVPFCLTLAASTKKILEEYVVAGGKIWVVKAPDYTDGVRDDWAFLQSNETLREIAAARAIDVQTDGKAEYTYRKGENFEFLYIVNVEGSAAEVRVPAGFSRIDLLSLQSYEHPESFTLEAGEGVLLMPVPGERAIRYGAEEDITSALRFASSTDNTLVLDMVQMSTDGIHYGETEYLAAAFDRLLRERYEGPLFVKYTFEMQGVGKKIQLRREKANYIAASLNGKPLLFCDSAFDCMFEEADISAAVKTGTNEYVNELHFYERPHVCWALFDPEATESVRNCLWYDTELENAYVLGDFTVDENRTVQQPVAPARLDALEKNGFPNFSGKVNFTTSVFGVKKRAKFAFEGDFFAVEVKVNGKEVGSCFWDQAIEVELKEGKENTVEFTIVSSLRNTFGPFHCKCNEDDGVSPVHFTLRGMWKDGKCDLYDPAYRLRTFGLRRVAVAFEE